MAHGEEFSNTLLVSVDGTPLPDDIRPLLVNGFVDDGVTVPDLFELRFSDDHGVVLDKAHLRIGATVDLSLQSTAPGGHTPLLTGEVTALEVEVDTKGVFTVVRGLDVSHRLFRGTRVEAYVNMTASDIVAKVADRAGLSCRVDATTTPLDHTSQDNVDDWTFLRRLAAENDRVVTLRDGTLEFSARMSATEAPGGGAGARTDPLVLEAGVSLVHLRGTITADGQVPGVEVRGWDPARKQAIVSSHRAETASATPDSGLTPVSLASTFDGATRVLGLTTCSTQAAADAIAVSLSDHVAGGFAELEGTARGNPQLRAGTAVTVIGVGTQFSGKYVLTSTRHDFSPDHAYRTGFSASNASERSLYGAATGPIRERPRITGVVPAVVTSVKDPDELGRVKIKLPWLADSYESWWTRTLQPGAGKDRGAVVLPEVGDEVLVSFAEGDLEHPYVLGGLYNGVDKPLGGWAAALDGTSGQVVRRAVASRSGMVLELLESAGAERAVLSTNDGGQRIVLDQSAKGIEITSKGPLTVKAQQAVELSTGSGDLTIKGANVTIEATAGLDLKGSAVKLVGQASAEVSASGATTVRGSIVRIN